MLLERIITGVWAAGCMYGLCKTRLAPNINPPRSILSEVVDEMISEVWSEVAGRQAQGDAFAVNLLVAAVAFSQGKLEEAPQVGLAGGWVEMECLLSSMCLSLSPNHSTD